MPYCSNCGQDVGTSQFCPNCGKPQGKTESYSENSSQQLNQNLNNQYQQNNFSNSSQYQAEFGEQYNQQQPPRYPPNYGGYIRKPIGLTFLLIYEIIVGLIIIVFGLFVLMISQSTFNFSSGQLTSSPSDSNSATKMFFFIFALIIILWGVLGIFAGILINQWSQTGYILTYIFLISTGILLFEAALGTTVIMIIYIIYFNKNSYFKESFKAMRQQKV